MLDLPISWYAKIVETYIKNQMDAGVSIRETLFIENYVGESLIMFWTDFWTKGEMLNLCL